MAVELANPVARVELPPGTITAAMIEHFERVGYVVVPGLLDASWLALLDGAMDEVLADSYGVDPRLPEKRHNTDMLRKSPTFRRVMFESPIAAASAALMGSPSARYYEDILVYVPEGCDDHGGWHQDAPTWPLQGRQFTNVWFSLDATTRDTGSLRIVAGSHLGPWYVPGHIGEDRREAFEHDKYLWTGGPLPEVDADPDRFPVATIETEPGDVVLFHPTALHQGKGRPAGGPRRTFTVRLFGGDVRWHQKRCIYHPWMLEAGLSTGDVPDHPRMPLLWARSR
jgi:ectoine hydroxylase-related dioxygenase (phytanoyl-CoA dioxygenase family)